VALAYGRFEDALRHLAEARALDPSLPSLGELTQNAEQQRAVAQTRAQRWRGFQAHLAAARALCARQDFAGASRRLNQALELRPGDVEAMVVKDMIREAQDRVRAARSSPLPPPSEESDTSQGGRDPVPGRADEPGTVRPAAREQLLDDERDLLD
jgi:tetratricopeptide (TPR) repeat protein